MPSLLTKHTISSHGQDNPPSSFSFQEAGFKARVQRYYIYLEQDGLGALPISIARRTFAICQDVFTKDWVQLPRAATPQTLKKAGLRQPFRQNKINLAKPYHGNR
jgi:hypothetical protein